MSSRLYVDVHALQTVPPSNVNRDDTGSPKTAVYGGRSRARVSSQSWKRAIRLDFNERLDPSEVGVRTKRVVELVAAEILAQDEARSAESAEALAVQAVEALGLKVEAKAKPKMDTEDLAQEAPQTSYLVFLSAAQISALAALAIEADAAGARVDKKRAKSVADTDHSIDLALFGRMVAEAPDLNVDAAAQVAHALSVHAVDPEFDYFTAVDDKAPEDNTGAGMIGTVEFNSSTLYRYATVNVEQLISTLGSVDAAARAVATFIRSFATSMPTGKQNTFANRTLPDGLVVTVRSDQPVSWVGAFEEAVTEGEGVGRAKRTCLQLVEYVDELRRAYGGSELATWVVRVGPATEPLTALGEETSFEELIDSVRQTVESQATP